MTDFSQEARPASRQRVLLVEDDTAVRRSLQLLLQARGFDVRAYAAGDTLLLDPSSQQAAGLVADYRMAGIDGLGLLSTLRQRGWTGRAVLITAHPSDALTARALALGYDAVIEKPFRRGALGDAMTALLDGGTAPPA